MRRLVAAACRACSTGVLELSVEQRLRFLFWIPGVRGAAAESCPGGSGVVGNTRPSSPCRAARQAGDGSNSGSSSYEDAHHFYDGYSTSMNFGEKLTVMASVKKRLHTFVCRCRESSVHFFWPTMAYVAAAPENPKCIHPLCAFFDKPKEKLTFNTNRI